MIWVQRQPCYSGSLHPHPHIRPAGPYFEGHIPQAFYLKGLPTYFVRGGIIQPLQTQKILGLPVRYSSHWPRVATEPLKCGWSKLRWVLNIKYTPAFKDYMKKNVQYRSHFSINHLLK